MGIAIPDNVANVAKVVCIPVQDMRARSHTVLGGAITLSSGKLLFTLCSMSITHTFTLKLARLGLLFPIRPRCATGCRICSSLVMTWMQIQT